jgi:hypothetical protein
MQGFYNGSTMISDTVKIKLRNASFSVVDSNSAVLSSSGIGTFTFMNAENGTPYWIDITHRNTVETYSGTTQTFISNTMSYDFTSAQSKAYGNNLIQVGTKWCFYVGDINQDGQVSLSDLIAVDNDNANYKTGYTVTDLTGDGQVTLGDLIIVDNNNANYIKKIIPSSGIVGKKNNFSNEFLNGNIY